MTNEGEGLYVAGEATLNFKDIPARLCSKTVRGLELDLYREVRKQALVEGVTVGKWINQAIREKLAKMK